MTNPLGAMNRLLDQIDTVLGNDNAPLYCPTHDDYCDAQCDATSQGLTPTPQPAEIAAALAHGEPRTIAQVAHAAACWWALLATPHGQQLAALLRTPGGTR